MLAQIPILRLIFSMARLGGLFSVLFLLTSCQGLDFLKREHASVVYALGSTEGFSSPINQRLKPACPALTFTGESFTPVGRHQPRLRELASAWQVQPQRLLIVGYTAPNLPQDYARALSERRAQGVRQNLVELGIEASQMQTVGLGNDFAPSAPSSNVVVIYQVDPAAKPAGVDER
jgi:hypothetical protein